MRNSRLAGIERGSRARLGAVPHSAPTRDHAADTSPQLTLTDIDRSTWRRLLARTEESLSKYGDRIHPSYASGFSLLFGGTSQLPDIDELNRKLQRFGWQTTVVAGYLPHDTYAEFLAARTFPVARDIRNFADVDHSPVPDLAHDLIGHLPMLVDEHHREFLRRMGEALSAAKPDARDHRLYDAQQRAGYLRRAAVHSPDAILEADAEVVKAEAELARQPSLLAQLGRLYLWTIEFGLLGEGEAWVAYGAALMSSARELDHLMSGNAQIQSLSVEAMAEAISFCAPQSGYFLARDHALIHGILDELVLSAGTSGGQTYPRNSYVVTHSRT